MKRAQFLCLLGLMTGVASVWAQPIPQTPLPGASLIPFQFKQPLPLLEPSPGGTINTLVAPKNVELHMREFRARMLPPEVASSGVVPGYDGTWVFGYINYTNGKPDANLARPQDTFTGPVIVAARNVPTQVKYVNELGDTSTTHVLVWHNAVDQTIHWADPLGKEMNMCAHMGMPGVLPEMGCDQPYQGPIPTVPHLHGGELPPVIDGGPDAWFTSDPLRALQGHGYYTHPFVPTLRNACVYRYPNVQEPAPIWFHDHLLGGTRINVYCGLAGAYDLIDPSQPLPAGLHAAGLLNGSVKDPLTGVANWEPIVPLVIQDRMFDTNGQLYFPTGLLDPSTRLNPEHPLWIPEFTGDTICVNGKLWPFMNVQAKRYRFLIIEGSNARPYALSIPGGPPIWQIATDGGYLDRPVQVQGELLLLPGERADIIIDFSGYAGQNLVLTNTEASPAPDGDPPDPATTGVIVQFRVGPGPANDPGYNPASLTPLRAPMVRLADPVAGTVAPGVTVAKTRQLTLNEIEDDPVTIGGFAFPGGPTKILVNNTNWDGKPDGGFLVRSDFTPIEIKGITDYYSEVPKEGTTEVWEIVNLTMDTHPIHTHLTQFQLVNREGFSVDYLNAYGAAFPGGQFIPAFGPPKNYDGSKNALSGGKDGGNPDLTPYLTPGTLTAPLPNEAGWKDTIQVPPHQVTRFVVRFAPQQTPVKSPRPFYAFDPYALGHGYVWHCHIVDHEDNEMMRPYAVDPAVPDRFRTYKLGIDY